MKTILITFSATMAAVALVASLFLQSILGAFGLAAISIDTLQNLRTSKQVVDSMKKRHDQKKLKTSTKLVKRSGKRIAATALAAATIGTVAVIVTMASLEVADYCEEKEDLQEDANILYGTLDKFDLAQCIEEGKKDSQSLLTQAMIASGSAVSNALESTARYSAEKWASIKKASLQALGSTGEYAAGFWDATKSLVVR
jgi:hypothetical protein